jgi:DNA-binding transcriptional MerR regulator
MVRKRDAHTRWRAKRTRPKTAAPTNGWGITELSKLSQVPVRRLRDYVARDLLEPLEFRGTATRYPRRALLRLLAIVRLRAESGRKLVEIKRWLDALGDKELETWLQTGPVPPLAAGALGMSAATAVEGSDARAAARERAASGSTWRRIALLPGLELMVSTEASPAVRRAAQDICEEYVGSAV